MKTFPRSVAGQASTEYAIVLGLSVMALVLSSMDPSPIDALVDAIHSAYRAFSYAISFSV